MTDLDIDLKGIEAAFNRVVDKLERREPLMREIAGIMHDAVEENFAQEGRPAWMGIKYREGKILQKSGRLAASITPYSDNDSAAVGTNLKYAAIHHFGGTIEHKNARSHTLYYKKYKDGTIGNRFVKKRNSNFTQSATIGPYNVDMPARPYLNLTEDDLTQIEEASANYVTKDLR